MHRLPVLLILAAAGCSPSASDNGNLEPKDASGTAGATTGTGGNSSGTGGKSTSGGAAATGGKTSTGGSTNATGGAGTGGAAAGGSETGGSTTGGSGTGGNTGTGGTVSHGACDSLAAVGTWEKINPPVDFATGNGPYGTNAFVVDPEHTGTVYLGTSGLGIWKTTDCGATWTHINTA